MGADAAPLERVLASSTRFGPLEHHTVLPSTNDWLADRPELGLGTVVVADEQTAGRGRVGRRWRNPPHGADGSLLCSTTVAMPDVVSVLPLVAGLAVARAVAAQLDDPGRVRCKWPNDVQVDGRKVAGLLLAALTPATQRPTTRRDRPRRRRAATSAQRGRVVVGLGLDVDWRGVARDDEAAAWTSVAEAAGRPVDRWVVLAEVLRQLDAVLDVLADRPHEAMRDYRAHCATLGRRVEVVLHGHTNPRLILDGVAGTGLVGTAIDLDPHGGLVVREDDGTEHHVHSGDVVHLRPADQDGPSA